MYTLSEKASDKITARLAERENKVDMIAGILEDVTVTAVIDDETGISSASLFYKSGGSEVFSNVSMSGSGNSCSDFKFPAPLPRPPIQLSIILQP